MSESFKKTLAEFGRIGAGLLLIAVALGKIVPAIIAGRTSFAAFTASFAGQPVIALGLLALWLVVLAGGLSYVVTGIARLRTRNRDARSASEPD